MVALSIEIALVCDCSKESKHAAIIYDKFYVSWFCIIEIKMLISIKVNLSYICIIILLADLI